MFGVGSGDIKMIKNLFAKVYFLAIVIAITLVIISMCSDTNAQTTEVQADYTEANYSPTTWTDGNGNENIYSKNDSFYTVTQWTNTFGRHHGRWIPPSDTLFGRRTWTFTGGTGHQYRFQLIRDDTMYVYTKRSFTVITNYFHKMHIDAGSDPTELAVLGNFNPYLHGMFMQNDTIFMAVHLTSFAAFGNSSGTWNTTYQDYSVAPQTGFPTSVFQFSDSEDAYFTQTTYGTGSSTPYTHVQDTSWIFKRSAANGSYTLVKLLSDSLGYRGMITGYINGSSQHVLYLVAQQPRYGAVVYQYIVETDALTEIGMVHDILGIGIDSAVVNNISSSSTGRLWMNAGNKYAATVDDTTHNRIYFYIGSSWNKLEAFPSTAFFNDYRNFAPNKLAAVGDSVFFGWGVEGIPGIDSTQSDDIPAGLAYAWASLSFEIIVTAPNGGETFTSGVDTTTVTWTQAGVDSVYISYSTDAGSTWILVDSTGDASYEWVVPDVFTTKGRIKVEDVLGAAVDESDNSFNILPTGAAINIIEPDGATFTFNNNLLKIHVESYLVDSLNFYYSQDSLTFILIQANVAKGGDAIAPDTTTIFWNVGEDVTLLDTTWYKVTTAGDSNLVIGNPNPLFPYYSIDTLTNSGQRGRQQLVQGIYRWSNFFLSNDILYTVGYFAFVWGWFDYLDTYYCFYWDELTNGWSSDGGTASSGAAFYPGSRVYHKATGSPLMIYYNEDIPPIHKDAGWTATAPPVLSLGLTSGTFETLTQAGINQADYSSDNDSVDYKGWKYYLKGTDGSIWAKDITNTTEDIDFYLLDADSVQFLDKARLNIFATDTLLFIANSDHKGSLDIFNPGVSVPPFEIVYTAPALGVPYTFAFDITSTLIITGQTRNFFRGIIPEAILIMRSQK